MSVTFDFRLRFALQYRGMSDPSEPDWIRKRREAAERQKAASEADANARLAAEAVIRADGPKWFEQLIKDLRVTVDHCPSIGIRASLGEIGQLHSNEAAFQVSIVRGSLYPQPMYTNIFYAPGASQIRCCDSDGTPSNLRFCLDSKNQLSVAKEGHSDVMTPSEASQSIVEGMIKKLERLLPSPR